MKKKVALITGVTGQDGAYLSELFGYPRKVVFDTTKPDGTPRKLMDVGKLHAMGWRHTIDLESGLRQVFQRESTFEESR